MLLACSPQVLRLSMDQSFFGRWMSQVLLAVIAGTIFFTNLGVPALWDIDEPRNAVCAREMLEQGDWIVPTFNGELRAHKPILLYWLMMASYVTFGVTEFAARFWSAALSIGTVLMVYHIARRLFGSRTGFLSALALASSLNFVIVARAATPDATFVFCTTAALATFVFAATKRNHITVPVHWIVPSARGFALVYTVAGLAVLAKGPVALIVICGPLLAYLAVQCMPPSEATQHPLLLSWKSIKSAALLLLSRAWRGLLSACRQMHLVMGGAIIGFIVLPWYVAVCVLTGGKWLSEFLFTHNLSRFVSPMENHRGPIFYYLIVVCVGLFPWSLFIYPTLKRTLAGFRLRDDRRQSYLFLSCWIGVVVAFFSLAATKLPSYIMPAYPALAILTGATLDALLARTARADAVVWLRRASWTLVVCGGALVALLPIVASIYLPGEQLLGTLGLVPLVAGILCLWLAGQERVAAALSVFAASAVLFCTLSFGVSQLQVARHNDAPWLISSIRASSPGAQPRIAGFDHFRPSWVYYANSHVDELYDIDQVLNFFKAPQGKFLVTTDRGLKKIARFLPADIGVVAEQRRFMHRGKLLVLADQRAMGRAPVAAARRREASLESARAASSRPAL